MYTQLVQLQKESLKKIHACLGFEPLTSAIPVQRFTKEYSLGGFTLDISSALEVCLKCTRNALVCERIETGLVALD